MRLDLGGKVIELAQGDLTREATDAIVNAANSSLLGGGGVDGAIHRTGGPEILDQCRAIRAGRGRLPPGHAVATGGGRLPARFVIHTVGPVWEGGGAREAEVLADCYRNSLRLADELELRSVAFPAISTGAYGYPIAKAAAVAVLTVRDALPNCRHVEVVKFILFDRMTLDTYQSVVQSL